MTIGAFCVILSPDNKILLCHRRDKDLWNLPGGRVESGESPWEAAVREVKEEVNLSVSIKTLVGCYFKKADNDLVFMFIAETTGDEKPATSNEADIVGYFPLQELPKPFAPKQYQRLTACFEKKALWPLLEIQ